MLQRLHDRMNFLVLSFNLKLGYKFKYTVTHRNLLTITVSTPLLNIVLKSIWLISFLFSEVCYNRGDFVGAQHSHLYDITDMVQFTTFCYWDKKALISLVVFFCRRPGEVTHHRKTLSLVLNQESQRWWHCKVLVSFLKLPHVTLMWCLYDIKT